MGDRWTTWIEKAVLLCRREIDDGWLAEVVDLVGWVAGTYDGFTVGQESRGQDCWWERVGLLGGREVDDLVGEVWAAGQERY